MKHLHLWNKIRKKEKKKLLCYIFFFFFSWQKNKTVKQAKQNRKTSKTKNKNKNKKTKQTKNKTKQNKKKPHTPQCSKWDYFFFPALFSPLFIYLLWANNMRKIRFHRAKLVRRRTRLNLIFVTNTRRKSLSNKSTKLCARVSETNRFFFFFFFCFVLFLFCII